MQNFVSLSDCELERANMSSEDVNYLTSCVFSEMQLIFFIFVRIPNRMEDRKKKVFSTSTVF